MRLEHVYVCIWVYVWCVGGGVWERGARTLGNEADAQEGNTCAMYRIAMARLHQNRGMSEALLQATQAQCDASSTRQTAKKYNTRA